MTKKIIKVSLITIGVFLAIIIGYVLYVVISYYRIEDNKELEIKNNQTNQIQLNTAYTAVTYNIGFGAYDQKYSFFMDTGQLKDGTKLKGKYGKAKDKENCLKNVNGAIKTSKTLNSDFYLFQEVDTKSDRSYKINQKDMITKEFDNKGYTFGVNYHSFYSVLPFNDMHGKANAGLLTLSNYSINKAIRKSYTVPSGFPAKYFDLDRCFVVNEMNLKNGKKLVVINSHMSAYDDGTVREKQVEELNKEIMNYYSKGHYVIIGGDFNQDLTDSLNVFKTNEEIPPWVKKFDSKAINSHFNIVKPSNMNEVPTCRNACCEYVKDKNYTCNVDGFIVSSNIQASALNIDDDFKYSDHNPVKLEFKLIG